MIPAIYEARFPFLREDVFLVAQVDPITGKQILRMEQVGEGGSIVREDALDCIHTAICDIPAGEFAETVVKEDFAESTLRIRSSENLREIQLSPEERFIAFRSWVAGIAEAGVDAFEIQGEIDTAAQLQFPITSRLLRFISQVDLTFLPTYLEHVDRMSQHEGVRERSYLLACLLPVLDILARDVLVPNRTEVLDIIFSMNPPLELFSGNWPLFRKLTQANPEFLPKYVASVSKIYSEMRGGGDNVIKLRF